MGRSFMQEASDRWGSGSFSESDPKESSDPNLKFSFTVSSIQLPWLENWGSPVHSAYE